MKLFFRFLVFSISLFAIASCSKDDDNDDIIWDIVPSNVIIKLMDESSNNLLDPNVEGNWVGEELYLTFNGEIYPVDWEYDGTYGETRMILPYFTGLTWTGNLRWAETKYYWLQFGEFSGEGKHDMSLSLTVPALNSQYDFKFTHELIWNKQEPHFNDHIIYDGKDYKGNTLTLVLPHNKTPYNKDI